MNSRANYAKTVRKRTLGLGERSPYFPEAGFMWLAIYRRSYLQQRQAQPDLFQVTPGESAYRAKFRAVFARRAGRLP